MATRDPVEGLKRFLNQLKRKRTTACRVTRAEFAERPDIDWDEEGKNFLVTQWQVMDSLGHWSRDPGTDDEGRVYPFAPAFWVDTDTALVSWVLEGTWTLYLVWRVGQDFGFRRLSGVEAVTVSRWNYQAAMAGFGFSPGGAPPA